MNLVVRSMSECRMFEHKGYCLNESESDSKRGQRISVRCPVQVATGISVGFAAAGSQPSESDISAAFAHYRHTRMG
jgi:hypothetical protein